MSEINQIWTVDQLLQQRAIDEDQTPLLAFPKTRNSVTDYEPITGASLNCFVDGAAKCLTQKGFPAVVVEQLMFEIASGMSLTDIEYLRIKRLLSEYARPQT